MTDEKEKQLLANLTKKGCVAIRGEFDEINHVCHGSFGKYKFDSINAVNFKPHPYMITPKHLEYPTGIYLDESAIERAEEHGVRCGWKGCTVPYVEHTSEKAVFLKVSSDLDLKDNIELSPFLFEIKPLLKQDKIDGVAFVKWGD